MLFTGCGDAGYTSVIGGPKLLKCDVRLEVLGALDEAQAHLGLARALLADSAYAACLDRTLADMRLLMGECAMAPRSNAVAQYLTDAHVHILERDIATWDAATGGFQGFATPGASVPGAHLHIARTVIRRAERQVVALQQQGGMANPVALTYLNRLSSWLYGMALLVDTAPGSAPTVAA